MKLRRRAEKACSRCGSAEWRAEKKAEVCAGCGKERSVSNWQYTLAGRERSTGTGVRALAEKIAAKAKTDYAEQGIRALVAPRTIPTLAAFSVQFLKFVDESQDLARDTKEGYRDGWRRLSATSLASKRLNDIGPADVSVLRFTLADGSEASGSTANQAIRTLSRMLSLAAERDYLKFTPTFTYRDERRRKAVIDEALERELLALSGPILAAVLTIMLDAGMRPEEVARMRWEHILWQDDAILVPHGKTRAAERYVPLTDRMAVLLKARKNGSEWVFPTAKAGKKASATGHVNASAVSHNFHDTLALCKGDVPADLVLYSARHSFATRFLKASGGDKGALKEIMGHSSLLISDRYVHGNTSKAAEVMNAYNKTRSGLRLVKEA